MIAEHDNALYLAPARDLANHLGIPVAKQNRILKACREATGQWKDYAQTAGIPPAEQNRMARAFEAAG